MGKIKNRFKKIVAQRAGFTLLELVIVIAIMAVLSTVGFVSLSGYRGKQNLKKTTDEVVAAIVGTQKRSISQDAGKRWNMRFSNSTSTGNQFIVFSGLSYATSAVDRAYGLSRNMQFSEPSAGNLFDAMFAPITGALPSKKIISIVTGKGDGFVGDIVLNTAGRVTERIENGLVGYWHFDEGVGTSTYDASGMGNVGNASGTTWLAAPNCKWGACLNFNGTNNVVSFLVTPTLGASNFSIFAWVNSSVSGVRKGILSYGGTTINNGANLFINVNNQLEFDLSYVAGPHSVKTITDGIWHLVGVTNTGGTMQLYIDGSPDGVGSMSPNIISGNNYIGLDFATTYFSGNIDEARVYNRALSATEVLNMYNDLK